ncbi:hypothetical protein [Planococcus soli]|nr:hypothetical protein [Planococcus soli]
MLDEVSIDYEYKVLIDILAESVTAYLMNNNSENDQEQSDLHANNPAKEE